MSIVAPIPPEWRKAVIDALRSGDENRIKSKNTADNEWGAAFPNSFFFERHEAMANALAVDGITGRHIADMRPPCDAYEFLFFFEKRPVLGKIGLLSTGAIIIIFRVTSRVKEIHYEDSAYSWLDSYYFPRTGAHS